MSGRYSWGFCNINYQDFCFYLSCKETYVFGASIAEPFNVVLVGLEEVQFGCIVFATVVVHATVARVGVAFYDLIVGLSFDVLFAFHTKIFIAVCHFWNELCLDYVRASKNWWLWITNKICWLDTLWNILFSSFISFVNCL